MAITNIDDESYAELYRGIDSNPIIQSFQKFKFRFLFPIFRIAKRSDAILDIGCARVNFLGMLATNGYTNLTGLDLKNCLYENLRQKVRIIEASITSDQLPTTEKFQVVTVQAMLHHLNPRDLKSTARNLGALLSGSGGGTCSFMSPIWLRSLDASFTSDFFDCSRNFIERPCSKETIRWLFVVLSLTLFKIFESRVSKSPSIQTSRFTRFSLRESCRILSVSFQVR